MLQGKKVHCPTSLIEALSVCLTTLVVVVVSSIKAGIPLTMSEKKTE